MFFLNLDKMRNLKVESDIENSEEYSDADISESEIKTENYSDEEISESEIKSEIKSELKSIYSFPQIRGKTVRKSTYILHLSGTSETNPKVAAGLSNNSCNIYECHNGNLEKLATLSEHEDSIAGVKFSNNNSNLLFTGSSDGTIKVWDLRDTRKSTITFVDETCESPAEKPISCFDFSSNERLLCAGTNLVASDAFILFWDIRQTKLLGGYWESHTDDITQVKFSPNDDMNKLLSASTDGLINLYDLQQNTEDDALHDTLNTESSVETITWHPYNFIGCITHAADAQVWKIDGVQPHQHLSRHNIGHAIQRSSGFNIYICNLLSITNGFLLLAGSNRNNGEYLRGLKMYFSGQVCPTYEFSNNEQRVRCCWLSKNEQTLFTGGEKGMVNVWNLSEN